MSRKSRADELLGLVVKRPLVGTRWANSHLNCRMSFKNTTFNFHGLHSGKKDILGSGMVFTGQERLKVLMSGLG